MGMPLLPVSDVDGAQCERSPADEAATAAIDEVWINFRRLMFLSMVMFELLFA
jgi:hypothetical protein